MSKRMQKEEVRREKEGDLDWGVGNGENREAEIRDKRLGCRDLRQLRRNREIRQILESENKVTAQREPRPTGRAPVLRSSLATPVLRSSAEGGEGGKLQLSPIQSPVTVSLGQPPWVEEGCGLAVRDFRYQFKCITVIHLIRGWAVTTCDFHDARLERRTGGIDRPAIKAKLRLHRGQRSQPSASPAIHLSVAWALSRCRRVPVPRRSADIPVCGC